MKALFNAIESLNIEDDILGLETLESEFNSITDIELDDSLEITLEQVNNLTNVIVEYGVTEDIKRVISIMSPALTNEKLSIEGLKDIASKTIEVIKKFFKMIWVQMKKVYNMAIRYLTNIEK